MSVKFSSVVIMRKNCNQCKETPLICVPEREVCLVGVVVGCLLEHLDVKPEERCLSVTTTHSQLTHDSFLAFVLYLQQKWAFSAKLAFVLCSL